MPLTVLTVVGARPQFVKAAPLSRELRRRGREVLVHTGQHYDTAMSDIFFADLQLPEPDRHLGIGSATHGAQTGAMLAALESVMSEVSPTVVLVYGDTNSTLAGALAAAKLRIPVGHVEAGLRSFNRAMPEEINRVVTDHLSDLLFVPSETSARQLAAEGITRGVHVVGDIMLDAVLMHREQALASSRYPGVLGLSAGEYCVCTMHRAENVDSREKLQEILRGLSLLKCPVVLPLHPRTRERLKQFSIPVPHTVRVIDPVGYLDMLALLGRAAVALTDSGGLQKEAYYLEVPCVTLRDETEWTETVEAGWNVLAGSNSDRLAQAVERMRGTRRPHPDLYGDGEAARKIVEVLVKES